jgi:hypothetical protein
MHRAALQGLRLVGNKLTSKDEEAYRNKGTLIGVDPLGVARSSRIHEICDEEEDEHDEHDELNTQIKGKLKHTRYTLVVLIGPIHQLNRITRKRLQE